jgi:DNA-binding MarR family transcriptional regulator
MKIDTKEIPYDMPAIHALILALLADAPEQTMSRAEIAEALQCGAFHVSSLVAPMKEQGLVRNSATLDEFGRAYICLRNAGQQFLDRIEVK